MRWLPRSILSLFGLLYLPNSWAEITPDIANLHFEEKPEDKAVMRLAKPFLTELSQGASISDIKITSAKRCYAFKNYTDSIPRYKHGFWCYDFQYMSENSKGQKSHLVAMVVIYYQGKLTSLYDFGGGIKILDY